MLKAACESDLMSRLFASMKGDNFDREREKIITGKASIGGSRGQRSCQGTQGSDTAADSGGSDFGESITANNADDIGTVGGIFV